jgi:hypothetical protein
MIRLGYNKVAVDPWVRLVYKPPPTRETLHSDKTVLPEMLTWAEMIKKSLEQVE